MKNAMLVATFLAGFGYHANASASTCGDGIVTGYEECDDGNDNPQDDCLSDCRVAICGDGVLWLRHEACDDGNGDDGDGCTTQCYSGPDTDQDGIDNLTEMAAGNSGQPDTDLDGTEDWLDVDSDNDTIADLIEGIYKPELGPVDVDEDFTPDYRDLDSDADGWSDKEEAGRAEMWAPVVDTDHDGYPDFRDVDSDDDGIYDEDDGCRLQPGDVCNSFDNDHRFPFHDGVAPTVDSFEGAIGSGATAIPFATDELDEEGGCSASGGKGGLGLGVMLAVALAVTRRRRVR